MGTCTFKVWRAAITARGNSVTLPGGAPSGAPEGAWNVEPTAAEGREPAKAAVEGLEIKGYLEIREKQVAKPTEEHENDGRKP